MLSLAFDPAAFGDPDAFADDVTQLVEWVKAAPPIVPDGKVLLPGEIEEDVRARANVRRACRSTTQPGATSRRPPARSASLSRRNEFMRRNNVREKLREGRVVYGIMAAEFFTPGFCQIASNAGAEFIIFDMEHGAVGIDLLKAQMAFARGVGVAPLVRVPGVAYHLIAPVLDAGAMGIMAPMVETREQAENLAQWCRYRPDRI